VAAHYETDGPVAIVTLGRPEAASAVDRRTAHELAAVFRRFEADDTLAVAVLRARSDRRCRTRPAEPI
jgi:enoyl-CoA hydratase